MDIISEFNKACIVLGLNIEQGDRGTEWENSSTRYYCYLTPTTMICSPDQSSKKTFTGSGCSYIAATRELIKLVCGETLAVFTEDGDFITVEFPSLNLSEL